VSSSIVSRRNWAWLAGGALFSAQRPRLPFKLQSGRLSGVRITLRAGSTKPKSGHDEIAVAGDGRVTLRAVPFATAAPKELAGKVVPGTVERLLELLMHEGIEGWDEDYKAQSSHYATVALTVEDNGVRLKQTVMSRPAFPEFAHAVGAIKLLAAQACPEAFHGGFFERL